MFSIDGIVSGFDSSSIIESLLGFQQVQIDTFNERKSKIATQQSAFKGIEAQLLTLKNSIGRLNRTQNSVFDVKSATSSHEDIVQVGASSGATPGVYNLTVNSLAAAHQIGSQGFSSSSDELGTGEISFQIGDQAAQSITIDNSNNTLTGFVNAVNDQVDDVSASIIFDQGSDSYRVLLTSKQTGAANEISVTSDLTGGNGTQPDFSGPPIQAASDAIITLGSGAGAITAQYESNQIEGLIEDVTLNLQSADVSKTVTVTVTQDNTNAVEAIEGFVEDFNSVMEFIDNQTRFVPETNDASPLLGNRSVTQIQNRLRRFAIDAIPGLESGLNRLTAVGIDIDSRGRLTVNSNELNKALNGEIDGVDPNSIPSLFGLQGSSNHQGVEFLTGGGRTQAHETPYEVNITQAATQAAITGGALKTETVIDSSNNEFQITVDGVESEVLTLAEGTYTAEQLRAEFESKINSSSELGVHNVTVTLDNDQLVITSEQYGSSSKVSNVTGSAAGALEFDGTEIEIGKNVAGTFIVDGVEEEARGSGRLLIGDSDNEFTADLQVRVTLSQEELGDGSEAEVSVTRGASGQLAQYLDDILDTETGAIKNINEDFESRIASIDESIQRVQDITDAKREFLVAEFTALESIINELQTTGNFLSSQLSTISPSNNKK